MMARTLRAEPSALRIAIRFLADAPAPGHQADAVDRHPHEQAVGVRQLSIRRTVRCTKAKGA